MHATDFEAVVYDGEEYCIACLPEGVDVDNPEVQPIFAIEERDRYPVCCVCHGEHDYVCLTAEGLRHQTEREGPQEGDYVTDDYVRWFEYGTRKPLLFVYEWEEWRDRVKAHQEEECYHPNCWWISDHGTAHLLKL